MVVFDRVRENLRKFKKRSLIEVMNLSINETMSRTVMTSVTTLLALVSLFVLGGDVIRGFVFAMIGVLLGVLIVQFLLPRPFSFRQELSETGVSLILRLERRYRNSSGAFYIRSAARTWHGLANIRCFAGWSGSRIFWVWNSYGIPSHCQSIFDTF